MARVPRLTLKQVQMLTPEQINAMARSNPSEVARALTTVQDVLKKRQKRAMAAGVDELPGLKNYDFVSTRGMDAAELKKQLKFAIQASKNVTSSITGYQKTKSEMWDRIKEYAEENPYPAEETDEETDEDEATEIEGNPFDDEDWSREYWDIYDEIKDSSQDFNSSHSWSSDTLQSFVYARKAGEDKSTSDIVKEGKKRAEEMYKKHQDEENKLKKEMEPSENGTDDNFTIAGTEKLYDI